MGVVRMNGSAFTSPRCRLGRPIRAVLLASVVVSCGGKQAGDAAEAEGGSTSVPDPSSTAEGGDGTGEDGGDSRMILAPPCAAFDGRVKCWGRNDHGQLGLGDLEHRGDEPGEMGDALPFVDLGEGVHVTSMAAGLYHVCGLTSDGLIKCWGNNDHGQLGLGDTDTRGDGVAGMGSDLAFVDLGDDTRAVAVVAGDGHTCALLVGGRLKCWGGSVSGQLGLGDTMTRGDEPGEMGESLPLLDLGEEFEVTAVAAGGAHTCALSASSSVKCWGANSSGQLGLGDTDNRGDEPGEMGDALPFVDLGADAIELGAGSRHTCALLTTGQVKCWGGNNHGQLGLGHTTDRDRPAAIDLGSGAQVASLATGGLHACALLTNGTPKCWGVNNYGQLGIGAYLSRGDEPGDMGDNLPPVDLGTNAEVVRMAPARSHFTCALLTGNRVKCWGTNRYGQLGLGTTHDRGLGKEPEHMGDNLPFVDLGFDID